MVNRQLTERLINVEATMSLEEYSEMVSMLALANTDQAVVDIRLHGTVTDDTLGERVSIAAMSHTACRDLHLVRFAAQC